MSGTFIPRAVARAETHNDRAGSADRRVLDRWEDFRREASRLCEGLAAIRNPRLRPQPIAPGAACSDRDDAALIEAIARDQDRDAFAALFDRVAPKIKGYLVFMGLADRAAEDMALEVMLVVWGRAGDFAGLGINVYTWIFTIVREVRVRSHARLGPAAPARPRVIETASRRPTLDHRPNAAVTDGERPPAERVSGHASK